MDGLEEFGAALEGVRVVGLGESTHGTAEFFRLKHRLFAHLVTEHGFRTLAMEASASAGLAVDAYVRDGAGDAATALTGLGFWTWRTREVLDLLEWMRSYNRGRPRADRIGFTGIDPQRSGASVAHFGPERAGVLSVLADAQPGRLPERRAELLAAAAELEAETSDTVDRWHARVLARAADVATVESRERLGRIRDGHMADGVDEAVAASGGAGVAVWAHNGHVGVRGAALGARLRERYGPAYYALGLFFGEGAFRARRMWPGPWGPRPDRPSRVAVNRIGPAGPDTLEALLAAAPAEPGVSPEAVAPPEPGASREAVAPSEPAGARLLDLRSRAYEEWTRRTYPARTHGAYVARFVYRRNVVPVVPGEEYDGLAYVPVSTPSRPL
ncbi:erythromycin esterase family protein [Streptomyces sp. cmx-4-7]|uniref:erythromycin esterase family protein n=1 Tax=Streptomyces sp. cmx-4-7 TaxID=2790939 RepID=UPI003981317B